MKYERQRHSQLFIALQERKKTIEKAATPYTLRGRVGIVFSLVQRNCAQFYNAQRHRGGAREPVQTGTLKCHP